MVFLLPPLLDITAVDGLKPEFESLLTASADLALDGSQVERVDAAGLQLLVALIGQAAANGVAIQWAGISTELRSSAVLVGLEHNLQLA